jgi:hypothetical protein
MKKIILFLIVVSSVTADAQSLKELLYSGKLKSDTGSVVRKSDDLSTKIDTSKKKPVETVKIKTATGGDSSVTVVSGTGDPVTNTPAMAGTAENTTPKDNNKIWKDYMDSLSSTLKTEMLPSKKIKSGTYYVLVEYEISQEGQVSVNNVSCSPESTFIEQQVKERLMLTAPQMVPVIANGKARKIVKKYNLILNKP